MTPESRSRELAAKQIAQRWFLRGELTDEESSQPGGTPADVLVPTEENDDAVSLIHDLWNERIAAYIAFHDPSLITAYADVVEAGRAAEKKQQHALDVFRSHGIVFEDIGTDPKNWQHVAFSVYTDLCEVADTLRETLARLDSLAKDRG